MSYTQVDELEVLISADASKFRGELADMRKQLNSLGNLSSTSLMGKLVPSLTVAQVSANLLTKGLGKTVNGIKTLTREVVKGGSEYARISMATETVASNMGIASEEVDNLRQSLADANTYGIAAEKVIKSLALTGLFQMAEGLEAVDARSGATEEGISALVLTMKDLSAAAGMDSVEGIEMLTRFIQGNAEAVQAGILQIGNLGTEYRMFAESIGKTRAELTATEEAQARMNILMREGQKAFGAYANTYVTSGKMASSIGESLKATFQLFGSYLEPIFATATSAVLTFVNNVRSYLIENGQTFRDWAITVSAYVVLVVRTLGSLLSRVPVIGKFMKGLSEFEFPKLSVSAENTAKSLGGVGQSMDNTTDSAKALKKELAGLAGFDEMNVLNPPEPSAGGVGGLEIGGISGALPIGEFSALGDISDEVNKKVEELQGSFDNLKKKIEEFMEVPIVKWLWENKDTILEVVGVLILLTGVIATVTAVFSVWAPVLTGIIGIGGLIASVFGAVATLIGGLITTGAIVPVLIASLVALLAVAVVQIIKHWDEISAFFEKLWNTVVEQVSWAIEGIMLWWDIGVNWIKDLWGNVTGWISDAWKNTTNFIKERIDMVKNWFSNLWEGVKTGASNVWDNIKTSFQTVADFMNVKIDGIKNWFGKMWEDVKTGASDAWEGIKRAFGSVADWFGDIFGNAWNKVKNVFSAGGEVFKGITDGIFNAFKSVVNSLITGINTVVSIPFNAINSALKTIKNTKIAGLQPFGWLPTIYAPKIPYLAQGGIVESPTVAMLGEAGKEAVVPLENNLEWVDLLSSKMGNNGQPIYLTVNVGDEKLAEKVIDWANDKSLRTNSLVFNI